MFAVNRRSSNRKLIIGRNNLFHFLGEHVYQRRTVMEGCQKKKKNKTKRIQTIFKYYLNPSGREWSQTADRISYFNRHAARTDVKWYTRGRVASEDVLRSGQLLS